MNGLSLTLYLIALVLQLGSSRWAEREAATTALAAVGELARPVLAMALAEPDLEPRRRAERLLAELDRRRVDTLCPGDRWPWIDMLPDGWTDRSQTIHGYLVRVGYPSQGWPWTDYREATRLWVCDQLQAGADPDRLREMLRGMATREAEWHARHGQAYQWPGE